MSEERFICICGAEYVPKTWKVWFSLTGDVSEVTGIGCPTKGCPANISEYAERQLTTLQKLSAEDRRILGLLYKPDYEKVAK